MTTQDMVFRAQSRLGDNPLAAQPNQFYTYQEVLAWINTAQRVSVLLTLFLEATGTLALATDGRPFYRMLSTFSDWLLPLRVRLSSGAKLRPDRLQNLSALDSSWTRSAGAPSRYALRGFDLLGVYQQPSGAASLSITYARSPIVLVNPTDVPELPDEYHPTLIDAAIVLCRAKEGAQEFSKVMPLWGKYLDEMTRLGDMVRHRSRERGYDFLPVELAKLDRSRIFAEVAAQ